VRISGQSLNNEVWRQERKKFSNSSGIAFAGKTRVCA